ncbi:hypothetical protein [Burkholderia sp. SCN-KJ]|uniref:hypothetical protein n=1 Tax=Burkholderia sp. SCN-KJ TaxID=2969248 RepID=UPI0035B482FC
MKRTRADCRIETKHDAKAHANPLTVSMCEQMCSPLVDARRARVGTSERVR